MKGARYSETITRLLSATNSRNESELAKALEITSQSVSQAKKKDHIPPQWFAKISQSYGVTLDWLLHGHEASSPSRMLDSADTAIFADKIAGLEKELSLLRDLSTSQKETISACKEIICTQKEALVAYKIAINALQHEGKMGNPTANKFAQSALVDGQTND